MRTVFALLLLVSLLPYTGGSRAWALEGAREAATPAPSAPAAEEGTVESTPPAEGQAPMQESPLGDGAAGKEASPAEGAQESAAQRPPAPSEGKTPEREGTLGKATPTPAAEAGPSPLEGEGEEIISLGTEMSIGDLVQLISELTGDTYVLDESVKGKRVTIIAPSGGFKRANAVKLFEAILDLNDFTIVKVDGINKIVQKREVKTESTPTEVGLQTPEPSDRYVTRIVRLKNLSAVDVANTLRPFVSREGDIVAYPASNSLVIVETRSNLNRLLKIIENIDIDTVIEFVKIKHLDAAEVASKIIEIFGVGTAVSIPSTTPSQPQFRPVRRGREERIPRRPKAPTAAGAAGGGLVQSYTGFKLITDERTNTLIITAHPDDLAKIKAIIKKLDVEVAQPEQGIYVIRLQNADSDSIVQVLANLLAGGISTTGRAQPLGRGTTTTGSRTTSSLSTLSTSGQTFGTLGSTGLTGGSAIRRQISSGGGLSSVVAQAEGLRITSDPATNSIIIVGSRKDYEMIKSVVDKLDIRRKQVFVEAAILEVGLNKLRAVGVNFNLGFTFNNDNLGFGGTQLPGVPSLLGVQADQEAVISLLGGVSGMFLGVVGEQVDPDGAGPIPPIPSFSALFQALASITDVNVLSTPSILTTDNEEAEIVVADVIPFPTGSTVGTSGVTVQTIDRQPVGIRLAITPQISEGDYLKLNIRTEVSAVRDSPVSGLNTQEFGIATTTRTADSSVVVKDRQTIVIGGLVQDRESIIESKVPLLGDIPLLGRLFKFRQKSSQKINLMILLTPRIVESEADMQQILEDRQRRNMLLQQRGFY